MEDSLVSIITASFNSQKYIAETIRSVCNQTHTYWEMIIVDDASADNTISIVSDFVKTDERIKLIQVKKNSGAGIARNLALSYCTGRYISFLDSDDLWKPEKLERQLNFLQKHNLPFTFSFYEKIDEDGKSLGKIVKAPLNLSYNQLFFCNYIGNLTGIYDSNFLGKIPIHSSRKRQDWMLWLSVLKKIKKAKPIKESLAYYRVRNNSISASKRDLLKHNYNVYRNFHNFSALKSVVCMIGFLFTQLIIKPRYVKKLQ